MKKTFFRVLIRTLIPYIILLVMFITIITVFYQYTFNNMRNNAVEMKKQNIHQFGQSVDMKMYDVKNNILSLSLDDQLKSYKIYSEEQVKNNYNIAYDLYKKMSYVHIGDTLSNKYFILYKNSKLVASSSSVTSIDNMLKTYSVNNYTSQEVYNYIFNNSYHNFDIFPPLTFKDVNVKYDAIPVIYSMGYINTAPDSCVVMLITTSSLDSYFDENNHDKIYIVNKNDDSIIYGYNKKEDTGKKISDVKQSNDIIYEESSNYIDWKYVEICTTDSVYGNTTKYNNIIIIGFIVIVIIGVLCVVFSIKRSGGTIRNLLSVNSEMHDRLEDQKELIRNNFLERWIKGDYYSKTELVELANQIDSQYIGKYYGFILCQIHRDRVLSEVVKENVDYSKEKLEIIDNIVSKNITEYKYIHDLEYNKIVIIYVSDVETREEAQTELKDKAQKCYDLLHINRTYASVCYSKPTTNINKIGNDLSDFLYLLNQCSDLKGIFITVGNMDKNGQYYYPQELENRIIQNICSGNVTETEEQIRTVLSMNIYDHNLSSDMIKLLTHELWATLFKCTKRVEPKSEDILNQINAKPSSRHKANDIDRIEQCVSAMINLSYYVSCQKETQKNDMGYKINKYMNEHFGEKDFGLQSVADAFDLSTAYTSSIYKSSTNENFLDALQRVRMEKAKHLLNNMDVKIKDIVDMCGYNSINTFGKAFKRMYGVSASEYRENIKNRNNK